MSQETLAGFAERAFGLLQDCLRSATSLHPWDLASVEDQLARFSLWTSSIGAFAQGQASMDHRLRDTPDVYDAVMSLLEALSESVQNCTCLILLCVLPIDKSQGVFGDSRRVSWPWPASASYVPLIRILHMYPGGGRPNERVTMMNVVRFPSFVFFYPIRGIAFLTMSRPGCAQRHRQHRQRC